MLVSRLKKTKATKDISRENKKSASLFLLKYYHNLNLFTRDDALCRRTETILGTVQLATFEKPRCTPVYILTKLSTADMLIFREMAQSSRKFLGFPYSTNSRSIVTFVAYW
jgi:hypothetical protein